MGNILWVLRYLEKNWKLMCIGIFCSLIAAAMYAVYPWTLKLLLDDVIGKLQFDLLLPVVLVLLSTVLIAAGAEVTQTYIFTKLSQAATNNIRMALFNRLRKLPVTYFQEHSPGKIMSYFTNEVLPLNNLYSTLVSGIVVSLAQIALQFGFLFYINLPLTLLTIAFIPLYFFNHKFFVKTIHKSANAMQEAQAAALDTLQENITHIREINTYDREGYLSKKFKQLLFNVQRNTVKNNMFISYNIHLSNIITFGTRYIIYGVGAVFALRGEMTIGELIAFVTYQTTLFNPIQRFLSIVSESQNVRVIAGRLRDFFQQTEKEIHVRGNATPIIKGNIVLDGVYYRHPSSKHFTLKNINLTISPGEKIVIVGESGAGKTTLFHLLAGFYLPTKGRVMVDGHDVRDIEENHFRQKVGVMFQETILFNGTIYDNILLSKPDATREEVEHAAKMANAHKFIMELPNGYQTHVGANGVKLSGGQRQRIALARLFLQNADVLLLDEPTSALDPESAYEVHHALNELSKDKTTIVISHQIHKFDDTTRIIVMDKGMIVETGYYQELMSTNSLFRKLTLSQENSGDNGDDTSYA